MESTYEQWKDEHCERENVKLVERRVSRPLAVWRAFAAPVGEPLDTRVRWFADAADHGALVAKVSSTLERWLRRAWQHAALAPSALVVEVVVNDTWGAVTSTGTPPEAPTDAPHGQRIDLVARALAQLTGEDSTRHLPCATYTAAVTAGGDIEGDFKIVNTTLETDQVRRALNAKLREVIGASFASAVHVAVFPDGSTDCSTWTYQGGTEVAGPHGMAGRDLLVAAREHLRRAQPMTVPSAWGG